MFDRRGGQKIKKIKERFKPFISVAVYCVYKVC